MGGRGLFDEIVEPSIRGVEDAARAGWKILSAGGSALDAVEKAVNAMEDNPVFDAGVGSVLNEDGEIEMDAIIMEGSTLKTEAVAALRKTKNPVSLAKKIMEKTEHVMIIGEGAERLARRWRLEQVPREKLVTEEAEKERREYTRALSESYNRETVAAVVINANGDIAAATSTGRITGKKAGRVGDVPIIGSGANADNGSGRASSTGHGESNMKVTLERLALSHIEKGESQQSSKKSAETHEGEGGGTRMYNHHRPKRRDRPPTHDEKDAMGQDQGRKTRVRHMKRRHQEKLQKKGRAPPEKTPRPRRERREQREPRSKDRQLKRAATAPTQKNTKQIKKENRNPYTTHKNNQNSQPTKR